MGFQQAFLIGCNYPSTSSALYGCVNDVVRTLDSIEQFGFTAHECTIAIDQTPTNNATQWRHARQVTPTKDNIIQELNRLATVSHERAGGKYWIGMSGHGTQRTGNDVADRLDEVFVTGDQQIIRDNTFNRILTNFHEKAVVFWLTDTCHSSTMLDLNEPGERNVSCAVLNISGCQDTGVSADSYDNYYKESAGALTSSWLHVIRNMQVGDTIESLFAELQTTMQRAGYTQKPQLHVYAGVQNTLNEALPFRQLMTEGSGVEEMPTDVPVVMPPVIEPPASEPLIIEPPVIEPAASEPLIIEPPVIEPPIIEPAASEPLIIELPVIEPPAIEPAVSEPLIIELPVIEPPASEPLIIEPPVSEPLVIVPPVNASHYQGGYDYLNLFLQMLFRNSFAANYTRKRAKTKRHNARKRVAMRPWWP
jgi:hypothetical protein